MSLIVKLDNCTEIQRGSELIGRVFALSQTDWWEKYISHFVQAVCNTCTSPPRCRMAATGGRRVLTWFSSPARSAFPAGRKLTQPFLSPRGAVSSKSSQLKHFPYPCLDASTNTCANFFFPDLKVIWSYFFLNCFFCCYVILFSLSFPNPSG